MRVLVGLIVLMCALAPEDARPVVDAVVAGPDADREAVRARLEEFLGDEAVTLSVTIRDDRPALDVLMQPTADRDALAHVIVDLREHEVRLLVVDGPWQRALARRIELSDGLDEVALEEIGYVVETSVRALLDGETIGVSLPEATDSLDPASAPPRTSEEAAPAIAPPVARKTEIRATPAPSRVRSSSVRRLELGGGYDVFAGSRTGAPLHGPRIEGAFGRQWSRVASGVSTEIGWRVPVTHGRGDLGIRLQSLVVRVHVETWLVTGGLAQLGLGLGPGLDVRDEAPVALAPSGDPGPRRRRALPVVSARLGLRLRAMARPRGHLLVYVAAGLEVDPVAVAYVTDEGGASVFRPWRARPGATVSLRFGHLAPWRSHPR